MSNEDLSAAYNQIRHVSTQYQAAKDEIKMLNNIISSHDKELLDAVEKVGMPPMGCDTIDWLVEIIEEQKLRVKKLEALIISLDSELEIMSESANLARNARLEKSILSLGIPGLS